MHRRFLAAVGPAADDARLARALGGADQRLSDGPLRIAATGAPLHSRCLLSGDVHTLAEVRAAAGVHRDVVDAEALLSTAYERLGLSLLGLLRGSFALLLWDPAARRLVAARDQMGEAGLVWSRGGGEVVIASEIVELRRALPASGGVDECAMAHWLAVSGMPDDRTLFAGVHRVRAGHLLTAGADGDVRTSRYWHPRPATLEALGEAEAAQRLHGVLATAVRRRIVDPGATAVLLSGGLDSSTVAALAARTPAPPGPVRTAYSATFPRHPHMDEAPLIDLLMADLGLSGARIAVNGGRVMAGALEYLERWSLPAVSPNLFFWGPLLDHARAHGVEVLLDGQGGDELFGLSPYLIADLLRAGRPAAAVGLMRSVPGAGGRLPRRALAPWLWNYGVKGSLPPATARLLRRLRGPRHDLPGWLSRSTARAHARVGDPDAWRRLAGPRWRAHVVSVTSEGMGPALAFDHLRRRDAMAGVISRHPLVDVDVVECVLGLDPRLAFHPHHSRPLLRTAMDGVLLDRVRLRRSKSSFDAVFHESLAGPELPVVRAALGAPDALVGEYVDLAAVRRMLDGPPPDAQGRQTWALHIWRLTTAELWLRSLGDPRAPRELVSAHGGTRSRDHTILSH